MVVHSLTRMQCITYFVMTCSRPRWQQTRAHIGLALFVAFAHRHLSGGCATTVVAPGSLLGSEIACFGDSHTRGVCGAPWLPKLQARLGRPCVNQGVDGQCASAIACRAATSPIARDAVVLAGTNDALLELSWRAGNKAMFGMYMKQNELPDGYEPSQASFGVAFRGLLAAVKAQRVIVVSLPPLGEAENGLAADVIAAYNCEIRSAVLNDPRAEYAPFSEEMKGRLLRTGGAPFDASRSGFNAAVKDMFLHRALRGVPLGPSFDRLARRLGRRAVHDGIHLTEASAEILVDVLADVFGKR
mmetsp:Transcript_25124/g.83812  ORF Transcript_25124/g.83812 Transcript_25124/m.83812 type:complete len:301 (+) Transcript_25124:85-987(+)